MDSLWRIALRCAYRLLRVWWWLTHPDVRGAYVAVWCDDRLLLIRNSYRSGETVPCGAVKRSEHPAEAAVRELAEEVGITVAEGDLRFAREVVVDFEGKRDHAHFFELHRPRDPALRIDRREVEWAGFVHRSQLRDRPLLPHVRGYLDSLEPASPEPAAPGDRPGVDQAGRARSQSAR
jgi:8-oxo-dGTP pyrophosphatase MutT (NUDIX family)